MNQLRYQILSEALTTVEANQRRFSRNHAMVTPREGYEKAWEEERQKADELRKMLQEVRYADEQGQ